MRRPDTRREHGVVLIMVLMTIFISSLMLLIVGQSFYDLARRDKEAELMYVGMQYQRAIRSYYNMVPSGGVRSLPASIEAMLQDERFPMRIRHLRKAYADPITGRDFEVVEMNGAIRGVRSRSSMTSFRVLDMKSSNPAPAPYSSFYFGIPESELSNR